MKNWMDSLNNSQKNKSDTFCILPWVHIATAATGEVRLCCEASGRINNGNRPFRLGTDSIDDVWNSESMKETRRKMLAGERVDQCDKCYKTEAEGGKSKRIWKMSSSFC